MAPSFIKKSMNKVLSESNPHALVRKIPENGELPADCKSPRSDRSDVQSVGQGVKSEVQLASVKSELEEKTTEKIKVQKRNTVSLCDPRRMVFGNLKQQQVYPSLTYVRFDRVDKTVIAETPPFFTLHRFEPKRSMKKKARMLFDKVTSIAPEPSIEPQL